MSRSGVRHCTNPADVGFTNPQGFVLAGVGFKTGRTDQGLKSIIQQEQRSPDRDVPREPIRTPVVVFGAGPGPNDRRGCLT